MRAGRGLHPPDDEPHRCGAGLTLEGGVELVSEVQGGMCIRTMGNLEDKITLLISSYTRMSAALITLFVLTNTFATLSLV